MKDIAIEMIGFKSGFLIVTEQAPTKNKRAYWKCKCVCGKDHIAMGKYLRRKEVKSCGCLNRQPIGGQATHGHSVGKGFSGTYASWSSMLQRCNNPKCSTYYKYGAKGTKVCKRWFKFENFLADMGERPKGKTIDRIKNSEGYYPENCRWATPREQCQNKTNNLNYTYNGQTLCLAEWARKSGISYGALYYRVVTKKLAIEKVMAVD